MLFQSNSDGESLQSHRYLFSTEYGLKEPEQEQKGPQSAKLKHKDLLYLEISQESYVMG